MEVQPRRQRLHRGIVQQYALRKEEDSSEQANNLREQFVSNRSMALPNLLRTF